MQQGPTSSPGQFGRLVMVARDGTDGPSFPLGEVTDIGRTEGDLLIAEDAFISPRHARLSWIAGKLVLQNLGSVNGVYVRIPFSDRANAPPGGKPKTNEHLLEDGDLLLIGQEVLKFDIVSDAPEGYGAASEHGALLFGAPAAPRFARLSQRTVEGVPRDVFYLRKAETVLGRETGDIVFTDDPFLSRRHAAIRMNRTTKQFTMVDLGSSNGSFVRVKDRLNLIHGDQLRIGQQLFRLDIGTSPVTPGMA